jgi:pyruvate dehydrogenase E2 component (dihydrolipoamide acetyltransferase)
MATEILMPALSPTMEEGTLAKWLVAPGATVKAGQIIAEIETDKATMEFEAVDEGVIAQILVPEGTQGVKVNTPIAILTEAGEALPEAPRAEAAAKAAPAGGPAKAAPPAPTPAPAAPAAAPTPAGARILASPLARRIAAERGIALGALRGSGPGGRIVRADLDAAPAAAPAPAIAALAPAAAAPVAAVATPAPAPAAATPAPPRGDVAKLYEGRAFTEVTLDGMRRTIAARLTEAKATIPHFYLRRDVRLDALLGLREQVNASLAPRGVKLSVNDFIIKATALALQQVPAANAVWAGDRILRLVPSDVAVAVSVEGGLFTPVIRDAHLKTLSALSTEMKDLAARARTRKLAPAEYQGGSMAISNLGMFGIDSFDAVINPPHGAILAVGAGTKRPVVGADGALGVATVMTVTLSVDHRVIDGALGAEWLGAFVGLIEAPLGMLA